MTKPSHTLLAAATMLLVSAAPCLGIATVNVSVGGLRDTAGTPITNTTTLWAIIYDDDGDGALPGGLATNESLTTGDAASTWSAFGGKTISKGTMIEGDRIIRTGDFNSSDAVAGSALVLDLVVDNLTPGRNYGIYWFPGRTEASNQIPVSGDFPIGGINEVSNFLGTRGTTIPTDPANDATVLLATDIMLGTLPTARFHAITASEATDTFANWIAGYPAVGSEDGFNDDPDGDGLDNGVESALGSPPDTANAGITVLSTAPLTIRSSQAKPSLTDVSTAWQWSADLTNWHASGTSNGSSTVTISESVTDSSNPDFDITEVQTSATGDPLPRLFLRFTATQNP